MILKLFCTIFILILTVKGRMNTKRPFAVDIYIKKPFNKLSEGSVLNRRVVLTTARSFKSYDHRIISSSSLQFFISVGLTGMRDKNIYSSIKHYKVHEEYDSSTLQNDIALAFLMEELPDNVMRVRISPRFPHQVKTALVYFGRKTSFFTDTTRIPILKPTKVKIHSQQECQQFVSEIKGEVSWHPSLICAGNYRRHVDKKRDSIIRQGGGAVIVSGNIQVGMVTFDSYNQHVKHGLRMFTNITYFHDWIITEIRNG